MKRHIVLVFWAWPLLALSFGASAAEKLPDGPTLNERNGFVRVEPPSGGGEPIRMEYTAYFPEGSGPFPLVVVNHGRSRDPRSQFTDRPVVLARQLVARGYAVVAPMRRGFARSEGSYSYHGCVHQRRIDADGPGYSHNPGSSEEVLDLHAFLNQFVAQQVIDRTRIVMFSQSGGFTSTLGYMTMPRSGVLGYVNFVGGGFTSCGSQDDLVMARKMGRVFGPLVKRPGLWIYAKQDSFVRGDTYRVMFDNFVSAGGKASWVRFDPPIGEGHYMLGEPAAVPFWWPEVEGFLRQLGLPTQLRN
jgi:dienelactone hydrolase